MRLRRTAAASAAIALCLTLAHDARTGDLTPYVEYVSNPLTFNQLRLGLANRVNALQADGSNRVWAVADKGVAGILVDKLAKFFPLTRVTDGLLGDEARTVAFGTVDGDEHFFLGYDGSQQGVSGLQYGRILSETGVSYPATSDNGRLLWPASPPAPAGINLINALSSDGADLWAATQGGLARWTLGDTAPVADEILLSGDVVQQVATDPWSTPALTVCASGQDLFVAPSETSFGTLPGTATVVALAFDRDRTLWVGTSGDELYRYPYSGVPAAPYGNATRTGPYSIPSPSLRDLKSLAVDPLSMSGSVIWIGTDSGAYFQPVDAASEISGLAWTKATTGAADANVRVYVDPSGNLWFGSSFGVRSLLSRLLTISGSQFVGYGAQATVTLLDVNPDAPAAPPAEPPAELTVYVVKQGGSLTTPDLTLKAALVDPATRTYQASFSFASATVPGQALGVADSTTAVFYDIAYEFGPAGDRRELPRATFSWANEVPFEDDAWIGGPCFLRSLVR